MPPRSNVGREGLRTNAFFRRAEPQAYKIRETGRIDGPDRSAALGLEIGNFPLRLLLRFPVDDSAPALTVRAARQLDLQLPELLVGSKMQCAVAFGAASARRPRLTFY